MSRKVKGNRNSLIENSAELVSEMKKVLAAGSESTLQHDTVISLAIKLKSICTSLEYRELGAMPERIATIVDEAVAKEVQNDEELIRLLNMGADHIGVVLKNQGKLTKELQTEQDSLLAELNALIINAETMKKKRENSSSSASVTLSELTVHSIEKTKAEIDKHLQEEKDITLIAENVSAIDLSYIQLILSIKKREADSRIKVVFKGEPKEEVSELLAATGFSTII